MFRSFTFKMYVVLVFEGFISLCLCSFSELRRYKVNISGPQQNSSYFSMFFAVLILLTFCTVLVLWVLTKPIKPNMKKFLQTELYDGIKLNRLARLQPIFFLARRATLCLVIICCRSFDRFWFMSLYFVVNLIHCILICVIRPFKNTSENITDIVNEMFMISFCAFLIFHRSENDWNNTKATIFYWALIMNNVLNTFISIAMFLYNLCVYSKKPELTMEQKIMRISPKKIQKMEMHVSKCLPRQRANVDLRCFKYRDTPMPRGVSNSLVSNPSAINLR